MELNQKIKSLFLEKDCLREELKGLLPQQALNEPPLGNPQQILPGLLPPVPAGGNPQQLPGNPQQLKTELKSHWILYFASFQAPSYIRNQTHNYCSGLSVVGIDTLNCVLAR